MEYQIQKALKPIFRAGFRWIPPYCWLQSSFFIYTTFLHRHISHPRWIFLKILTEIIHKLIHHRLISCLLKHRDHKITPAVRVTDRDQDNTVPRLSTPGFFRPEADSKPCRDQVSHRLRTVALEHRLRTDPRSPAEIIADPAALPEKSPPADIPVLPHHPEVPADAEASQI